MTRFLFTNLRLGLIAMAISPALIAAEKIPNASPELLALKMKYEEDTEEATKRLRERYIANLQSLLRSTATKGQTDALPAIQAELARVDTKSVISGKWQIRWSGGSAACEFKANQTWKDRDGKVGSWKVADQNLVVTYPNGGTNTFPLPLDPKGTKGRAAQGFEVTLAKE